MYIHHMALGTEHGSTYSHEKLHGQVDYLFLYFRGACTAIINEKAYTISSDSVVLIAPFVSYKHFSMGSKYEDDYFHFHFDNRREFESDLGFPLNIPIPVSDGANITGLLKSIYVEYETQTEYTDRITTLLTKLLMIRVEEYWKKNQSINTGVLHYRELAEIRDEVLRHPEKLWTVECLAEQVHLSDTYFQVLYKKAFGVNCIADVINAKISKAKELLSSTNLSINQLSQELGYSEVCHFIRQFKKHTGLTPGTFRKKIESDEI